MDPIKVALRGFDQRSADRFRNIFLINYRGKCVLTDPAEADVTLVDMDGMGEAPPAPEALDRGKTILLSESGTGPEGFQVLGKPAKLNLLWDALHAAHHGNAGAAPAAQAPAAQASAAAASVQDRFRNDAGEQATAQVRKVGTEARYDPADYFIGVVLEALAAEGAHHAVQLTTWNLNRLVFHPASNTLYSDLSRNRFRALAATPLARNLREDIRVDYLPALPTRSELEGMETLSCEYMLWELAYATSRGRLPEEVDPDARYSLARWPNFTRLPAMPNGMRIAAVWAGEPQRLEDIATRLAIPVDEVHAFYAGASALGLAACAEQQEQSRGERRQDKPVVSRGLLGSLLGHLGSALRPRGAEADGEDWPLGDQA